MTASGDQRSSRIEKPAHRVSEVVRRRSIRQVPVDVVHGAAQHVQLVTQIVELSAGDDERRLVEPVAGRPLTGLEVALPAGPFAELPGPPDHRLDNRSPAPAARRSASWLAVPLINPLFRHSDDIR